MNNRVVLISPHTRAETQRLPIALMSISSFLTSKGIYNDIIDIKKLSGDVAFNEIVKKVKQIDPDIIGVTCCATEIFEIKKLCSEIKKLLPSSKIVLGGPHPTYRPEDFVRADVTFDYIVVGEGEKTLYELVVAIRENKSIDGVRGLFYQGGRTEPRELIENLDELPMIAYNKIDMDYYTKPNVWAIRPVLLSSLWVFSSRGCPFKCKFCVAHAVFGRKIRYRSPERVVNEIKFLISKYKIDGIFFGDESFTLNRNHISRLCELLREIDVVWGCQTRAGNIDENLLQEMKWSGCIQIGFGIESGSDKMLKVLNKGTNTEQYRKAGKICKKAGMRQLANMMINVPTEELEDIDMSVNLLNEIEYNVVLWNVYTAFPGVSFGKEMELSDLALQTNEITSSSLVILEQKYKFGNYKETISKLLTQLFSMFPSPRHVRLSFNPLYYYRWIRFFSYIYNYQYLIKVMTSKRKKQYLKALLFFSRQSKIG